MSFNRRVRSITKTSNQVSIPNFIWISDDILHRTLQRLFRPQCLQRHGSFVPGPLESRKRATRRRIMGLAPVGVSSPGAVPGFLAPLRKRNQQEWQWQPPSDPRPAPEPPSPVSPFLPEWLTRPYTEEQKSNDSSELELPLIEEPADPAATPPKPKGLESTSLAAFLVKLHSCNNLEDIQTLALEHPFATDALRSHAAFRHLLKQDPSIKTIISFFENSKIHFAESHNLTYLFATHFTRTMIKKSDVSVCSRWIREQIRLGTLSHAQIMSLFTTLTHLIGSKPRKATCYRIWRNMWEGIKECPSYYDSNVQVRAFHCFVRARDPCLGILSRAARRLGLEVMQSHVHLDVGIQQLCLHEFIKNWQIHEEPFVLDENLCVIDKGSSLLGLLQAFPTEMVKYCLRDASEVMLNYLLETDSCDDATVIRIHMFRKLGFRTSEDFACIKVWENVELTLAQKGIKVVSSYVAHMDTQSLCVFVLKHWYTPTVCQQLNTDDYSSFSSCLVDKFKKLTLQKPHEDPFLNLLITIRSFMYPFPRRFQERLLDLLRALNKSDTIPVLLTSPKTHLKFHVAVILAEIRHYLSKGQDRTAYKIFRSFRGISLGPVPELAEIMIRDPTLRTKTALNLHLTRIQSRDGWQNRNRSHPLRTSRLEMFNRIALAYAKAAHLSPRQAYRMAYTCYRKCKYERLPITASMTKALVLAGCIRFLKQWRWVSTLRFHWILQRVREVEGDEVAEELDKLAFEWRNLVIRRRNAMSRAARYKSVEREGRTMRLEEDDVRGHDWPRDEWRDPHGG